MARRPSHDTALSAEQWAAIPSYPSVVAAKGTWSIVLDALRRRGTTRADAVADMIERDLWGKAAPGAQRREGSR